MKLAEKYIVTTVFLKILGADKNDIFERDSIGYNNGKVEFTKSMMSYILEEHPTWLTPIEETLVTLHDGTEVSDPDQILYGHLINNIGSNITFHLRADECHKFPNATWFKSENDYKKHFPENEKKYSEKDLRDAFIEGRLIGFKSDSPDPDYHYEQWKKSREDEGNKDS